MTVSSRLVWAPSQTIISPFTSPNDADNDQSTDHNAVWSEDCILHTAIAMSARRGLLCQMSLPRDNQGDKDTYLEGESLFPEPEILCGDEAAEEDVDALSHTEGHGHHSISTCNQLQCFAIPPPRHKIDTQMR